MVTGSISSCEHKVYLLLWQLSKQSADRERGLYFFGHDIKCQRLSSRSEYHHKFHFLNQNPFPNQYVTTFPPAEAMNIHVHNTRGLRGNGQRVNLFLQAQSLFFTLAFVSRTKKSADRRRGLYFFGHDIKCQRLSSRSEYHHKFHFLNQNLFPRTNR